MWDEKPRRFHYSFFPIVQLAGLRSQEGLLTWAEKPKRSFKLYVIFQSIGWAEKLKSREDLLKSFL